jgi:hypothetical protein
VPSRSLLLLVLLGCEAPIDRKPPPRVPTGKPMTLPNGASLNVSFDRFPNRAGASPEALRQYLESSYWSPGTKAEIAGRKSLPDGFSTTLLVRHAGALAHPLREVFVMRQLGNAWFGCTATIVDEAMHDPLVALCRGLPRPD